MCVVAFLDLQIVLKLILSKLTYVSELLDFEQIKFPEKAVLLETPLKIS